jgi:hypothetical protein
MNDSSSALVAPAAAALRMPANSTAKPATAIPATASHGTDEASVPSTISTMPTAVVPR